MRASGLIRRKVDEVNGRPDHDGAGAGEDMSDRTNDVPNCRWHDQAVASILLPLEPSAEGAESAVFLVTCLCSSSWICS